MEYHWANQNQHLFRCLMRYLRLLLRQSVKYGLVSSNRYVWCHWHRWNHKKWILCHSNSSQRHIRYKIIRHLIYKLFLRVNYLSRNNIFAAYNKTRIGIGNTNHCNRLSYFQHAQYFIHALMLSWYKTYLRIFVTGFKQNNSYEDIMLLWLIMVIILFWIKLSVVKKWSERNESVNSDKE